MIYIAYLDEFGHIGPYVSRDHAQYRTSPVFGLAGMILPAENVRSFATWFFQRKCELLGFEIARAGEHPARWEKKGSSLYTVKNILKYPELRKFTHRFLNKIQKIGGYTFFAGTQKFWPPDELNASALYRLCLRETLKRLNDFCEQVAQPPARMLIIIDEHPYRQSLLQHAAASMFGRENPRRNIIEPPLQAESHMYQTLQAADWIAGLVGRIACIWACPAEYEDFIPFRRFERHLNGTAINSGVATCRPSSA
jgi:hypothetical protein